MAIDSEKLYDETGRAWRHFASWREKIIAGYLTVLAALGIAFSRDGGTLARVAISTGGILVSVVFWILDFRNQRLLNACQAAARKIDKPEGCYAALSQVRFEYDSQTSRPIFSRTRLTYGLGINLLVSSVIGACFGAVCIYVSKWRSAGFRYWGDVIAGALVIVALLYWFEMRLGDKQWTEEAQRWNQPKAQSSAEQGPMSKTEP